jgi:hypothetical protein
VGDKKGNTGEDRGYVIDTGRDLMTRYSIDKKRELFRIVVTRKEDEIGELFVELIPPEWEYIVLKINDQKHVLIRPDEPLSLSKNDRIYVEEIKTNLHDRSEMQLRINGKKIKPGELRDLDELCSSGENQFDILSGSLELGRGFINMQ